MRSCATARGRGGHTRRRPGRAAFPAIPPCRPASPTALPFIVPPATHRGSPTCTFGPDQARSPLFGSADPSVGSPSRGICRNPCSAGRAGGPCAHRQGQELSERPAGGRRRRRRRRARAHGGVPVRASGPAARPIARWGLNPGRPARFWPCAPKAAPSHTTPSQRHAHLKAQHDGAGLQCLKP